MESALEHITDTLIRESNSKYFEDGMVRKLHNRIDMLIQRFQKSIGEIFFPKFIWAINEYGLKHFIIIMESREQQWNEINNPVTVLANKEREYKMNIDIRLEYGFTYDGEGRIVGEKIVQTLHKLCSKFANKSYRDSILAYTWMTNSGNVRLEYFKELVREIQSGNKSRALKHFQRPRDGMNKWFCGKVDSFSRDEAKKHYHETASSEFEHISQCIQNENEGSELKKIFDKLFSKVDGIDYRSQVDYTNAQQCDYETFKAAVLKELEGKKRWLTEVDNMALELPSENPEILSRLGCTEHCFWCGALCWGQFGHEKNTDGTGMHHTCHQPNGLIGTFWEPEMNLAGITCDKVSLDTVCKWGLDDGVNGRKSMKWRDAMVHEDFKQWTFAAHPQNEFNALMKWFFINLHGDIAKEKGVEPATSEEMQRLGYNNLSVDSILITIETKIGYNVQLVAIRR